MGKVCGAWVWIGWVVLAACGCGEHKAAEPAESRDAAAEDASSGGPMGETLRCGAELCERPARFTDEPLCCADPFSGGCGVLIGETCQKYSKRDPRCPVRTPDGLTGADAEASGTIPCCASNGECGLDFGAGLGCISTSQACGLYPREYIELLGSQTCEGEMLEIPADCGGM